MTRAELRAQLVALVNRTDFPDTLADAFIDMGIRKLERNLRVPTQEKIVSYIADGTMRDYQIPNDLLEVMAVTADEQRLTRVSGSQARMPSSGAPTCFWRYGNVYRVYPTPEPGTAIDILYYSEFEALGAENYETAELSIYPDAVIYAALLFAADHFVDDRLPGWAARYQSIVDEIIASTERDAHAGGDLRIASPYEGMEY